MPFKMICVKTEMSQVQWFMHTYYPKTHSFHLYAKNARGFIPILIVFVFELLALLLMAQLYIMTQKITTFMTEDSGPLNEDYDGNFCASLRS